MLRRSKMFIETIEKETKKAPLGAALKSIVSIICRSYGAPIRLSNLFYRYETPMEPKPEYT